MRAYHHHLNFIVISMLVFLASACKDVTPITNASNTGSSGGGTSTPTPTPTPTPIIGLPASVSAGVYLKVESSWEGDDNVKTTHGICAVPLGTNPATLASAQISCNISVPEAQVRYSKFHFTYGSADATRCTTVTFKPYFYQGEAIASFTQPWFSKYTSPVDCTTNPINKLCFNGPATEICEGFPLNRSTYVVTAQTEEDTRSVSSGNSLAQSSNRWIVNDKSNWSTNLVYATLPGPPITTLYEYVGSNQYGIAPHSDYTVECRDLYEELIYSVTVKITDINSTTDNFPTWP